MNDEGMSCGEGMMSLPAYLDHSLDEPGRLRFEQHLETCATCRGLVDLWNRMGALPEASPGPRMRRRFEQALSGQSTRPVPRGHPPPKRMQWVGWAAAAMLFVGGGWIAGRLTAAAARASASAEMTGLREEVRNLRTLVALSLLTQQSASERLKGISYAGRLRDGSRDVVEAMVSALRYDSNVNVRLAACDALRRYASDGAVRRAFVEALGAEESPLVKVALIDALVDFRERESVRSLVRISASQDEDGSVKERAARALDQMKGNDSLWKQ
jgi:anti-sigma factor RsiW